MSLPALTLVLGGASSGKSTFAEGLVTGSGRPRVYLATSQVFDAEMRDKVDAHVRDRGPDWITIEEPYDIAAVLARCSVDQAILLDCATMWLTNVMLADMPTDGLCAALADAPCPVTVVSNEVGQGIVPDNALARQFRGAQGRLNAALAAQADLVVQVIAGLPLVLKGQLPR